MPIALKQLPSPSMGEGSGGGGTRASSPPSQPSPARGEGVFTSPCEPSTVVQVGSVEEGVLTSRCQAPTGRRVGVRHRTHASRQQSPG
jgi:hypothetical protein